ncbi:MAG: ribosome recycling factor [Candidatus Edwardsbacteria bacterium]
MIEPIFQEMDKKMNKAVEALRGELASIRTGRASPALLDSIKVNCYGSSVPLQQVAGISTPELRLLLIQPWDKTLIPEIEKAILRNSELGLTPTNDGKVIRLPIPSLTEERRKDLVKVVKKLTEDAKVAIRNVRREANEAIKKLEHEKKISEDESKKAHEQTQKVTDKHIGEIEEILKKKEKEIMEV